MTNLTKSLLDAISIIADRSAEEVSSDKTIKAVVKKVVSTSERKYLVTYNSGDFYAYVQSGSTDVYKVGEQIYILVPEGDMSQKKFIIGKVEGDEKELSSKVSSGSLLNDYTIIGDNIIIENKYKVENSARVKKMQPLELNPININDFYYCYLRNPNELTNLQGYYNNIDYPSVDIDEEVFKNSAKEAEALMIRAKFKTSINVENIGNYGIIVNIAFADDTNPQTDNNGNITYPPKLIAYVLDTSKMTGNPMKFYDYTSQYMVANFDGEKYLYIDSIVAFGEGFTNQSTNSDDIKIFIDDLEIFGLREISAIEGDYKLRLLTPKGNTVRVGERTTLKITASMSYIDQDITENTSFYWGIKDPSITSISENYNAKLGSGYRYIDNKNSNELLLPWTELTAAENIFICVAVYEFDIRLKTSLSMYNNNNKLDITIESDQGTNFQFNEGNPTLTCLINGKLSNYQENYPDSAFSFIWSKEDSELGSILLNETKEKLKADEDRELEECNNNNNGISDSGRTKIEVLSYYETRIAQIGDVIYPDGINGSKIKCKIKNINNYVTYSCSIYRAGIYIGYGSITLHNAKEVINNNYYITIQNGTQVFQYDERGIAPNSEKQNHPIQVSDLIAVFHSPQGTEVTPKRVYWIVPEDSTLIEIPSLGLRTNIETGERYFSGDIFPLKIKEVYDNSCINNQLTVVVIHADGTEYRQMTNLLFTKIGDIGTNGTGTVVKINESIDIPKDECLTLIKQNGNDNAFYNDKNKSSDNNIVLNTSLYTNNSQVFGYNTKWTIAGTSEIQSYCYQIENDDNACAVHYNINNTKLDTRIIKAQVSLGGKYFSSFYGIPTIQYLTADYPYNTHKIKVMKDKTLKNVLYDSNGTNPSYNVNQGIHVELEDWNEIGYLEWEVESGLKQNGFYNNPNILLSRHPKSKTGSKQLVINDNILDLIFKAKDIGENQADDISQEIKDYINEFLIDIKKIGLDTILSISKKLNNLYDRTENFLKTAPDIKNIYIIQVYNIYSKLFQKMIDEYTSCKNINKESVAIYEKIQNIWNSEWPNVITKERLYLKQISTNDIKTIQQLIDKYQQAYDNRSNSTTNVIIESIKDNSFRESEFGFENAFIEILEDLDSKYNVYNQNSNNPLSSQAILVEYSKILIGYLDILMNKTQDCLIYSGDDIEIQNLYTNIKNNYDLIYQDWLSTLGENIYNVISMSNEIIANVYENVRGLYEYYQKLYKDIKKYQIAEESETLKAWNSLLNGEEPNLLKQIYVIPNDVFNGIYMNNNVVGTAFIKNNGNKIQIAKIYIPIIMTLNTYELAALNGWDGTSVEIGNDHIVTPQIGAGIKDEITNTFTGMVMGEIVTSPNSDSNVPKFKKNNKVGLIGYSNGKQSLFIDAKTGKTILGLPENDENILSENINDRTATIGTNEGRIELIPGGVSKIGNWKIGNRFLYNIINGNYERRVDKDDRNVDTEYKLMVPHDKYGIILSSDQPYIHIKGKVYEKTNLRNINYTDEYNEINPGDSLELRLDPNNKSLFSIVQHTVGFGDEENDNLYMGYATNDSTDLITVVQDYVSNQNISENDYNLEYYVYSFVYDEINQQNKPYYIQQESPGLEKEYTEWEDTSISLDYPWLTTFFDIYQNDLFFKDAIEEIAIKRAFQINSETGVIIYNPSLLVWKNNARGISNNNGWRSNLATFSSDYPFSVEFNYNKTIKTSINKSIKIGKIKNDTIYSIYKLNFEYSINYDLLRMTLNDSVNNYIQFYIVENENDNINEALLKSDKIKIYNNENHEDINIELLSYNNNNLSKNVTYCLKMDLHIGEQVVNSSYFYPISSSFISYKTPPNPEYGTLEITNLDVGTVNFTTSNGYVNNISGSYEIYISNNEKQLRFKTNGSKIYDFILWRRNESSIVSGGRTIVNNYAKFFTNQFTSSDQLENYYTLSSSLPLDNHWCISFYPVNYCTQQIDTYEDNDTSISNGTEQTTETGTNTITKYKLITIPMEDKNVYEIVWPSSSDYNAAKVFWKIEISDLDFKDILGFIPEDTEMLCVQGDARTTGVQGIPYSKTYRENGVQKVTFYDKYYELVNKNDNQKTQYAYINVDSDNKQNPIYYKYIKTLSSQKVNGWFEENPPSGFTHANEKENNIWPWISGPTESLDFQNAIYWKEFIRVGLDENGRLFSAGIQDKRTYSRTGRLHAFGNVLDLYGQEIRTQLNSNTYMPIVKIFTQIQNQLTNTTYITQGKNDTGNISIRTGGGYVELAASNSSEQGNRLIPDKIAYIQVKNNEIINQVNYQATSNDDSASNNYIKLTKSEVKIGANIINISSNNEAINCRIDGNYTWIKTPSYIISSLSTSTPGNAYSATLYNINTVTQEENYYYRIAASSGENNQNPEIKLQVGQNTKFNILRDNIVLQSNNNKYIKINNTNDDDNQGIDLANFTVNNTKLYFKKNAIGLQNQNVNINLFQSQDSQTPSSITLSSSNSKNGSKIEVSNGVIIKGTQGFTVIDGPSVFEKQVITKSQLYSFNDIHVGYNINENISNTNAIYIYREDGTYVRLLAKDLRQLFDWYNENRWSVGWDGNTVWLKNVGRKDNPEGAYEWVSSRNRYDYVWKWETFDRGYKGEIRN